MDNRCSMCGEFYAEKCKCMPEVESACSKVYANSIWQTHNVDLEIITDRFWLKHGDNGSGDHQMRLEPDGTVYLGYTANCRRDVQSVTLSFAEFDDAFRDFVDECIAKYGKP